MSSTFGEKIKISVFGESHGNAIGVVIDGFPAGLKIDMEHLLAFMARRAPGQGAYATARREADMPKFLSGVKDGVTTGFPIAIAIENTDQRSKDYNTDIPRPGHADFTAHMRYGESCDMRGGGHFSGRITAPICAAGALCIQLLAQKGITVGAHIYSVGDIYDTPIDAVSAKNVSTFEKSFPVFDELAGEKMLAYIAENKALGDSVGGIVECAVVGLPAGIGNPMFDGLEGVIAKAVFAVPAVKGVEFGLGFEVVKKRGSENNDGFYIENGVIKTVTNNCGGILGGISTGMPLVFRAAFKPTPSIALKQRSVSISEKTETQFTVHGRHDPCIVPRAVPVIEAVTAIAVAQFI